MSGRHLVPPRPRVPSRRRLVVVAAAALAAATAATVVVVSRPGDGSRAAATQPVCAGTIALKVLVSPAIATPVQTIAAQWKSEHPVVDGRCVQVDASPLDDALSESVLANPAAKGTTLWIPDSTLWAQRLADQVARTPELTSTVKVYPSIASSPVVVAGPPPLAARLSALDPARLARAAAGASLPIAVLDPLTHSEGLLSLLTLRDVFPAAPLTKAGTRPPSRALIALMVRLSHDTYATPGLGFDDLAAGKTVIFATSEQGVLAANRAAGRTVAGTVYSPAASYALDYPVVTLSRPSDDAGIALATDAFQRRLRAIISQGTYAAAGLRDPAGDPFAAAPAPGSTRVTLRPPPKTADAAGVLRLWSATKASSHTLAVFDVSGSMGEPAGNGTTKIAIAAAAAVDAVSYFPNDFAFGLWAFSSDHGSGTPWISLAPTVPVGSTTGGITQRQRLIAAAARLPELVGGETALYDTALAAFQQIRNTYDPNKINSVVLMTDGQNEYPAGMTLDALLTQLRLLVDPARPVPIITIGIGTGADLGTLRQISSITGGTTYAVRNATDIGGVFLDAMLQRQCRPTC